MADFAAFEAEHMEVVGSEGDAGARNPDKSSTWRVVLFRAIKTANIGTLEKIATEQPTCVHERFTTGMHEWELEWESPRWNEYREATCMFIACAYTQPTVVDWLLNANVDLKTKCGFGQTCWDVIGHFNGSDTKVQKVKALLGGVKRPMRPPRAPLVDAKISYEEHFQITYEEDIGNSEGATGSDSKKGPSGNARDDDSLEMQIKVPKRTSTITTVCKVLVEWRCYWLPPGLLCELRYRLTDEGSQDWTSERTNAWKKTLLGLREGGTYAFQLRGGVPGSAGSVRWSEWGDITTVCMPRARREKPRAASPEVEERDLPQHKQGNVAPPPSRAMGRYGME